MRRKKLLQICIVALFASFSQPEWFDWLARIELRIFPIDVPDVSGMVFHGIPPLTDLLSVCIPFLGFPIAIAALAALLVSFLVPPTELSSKSQT